MDWKRLFKLAHYEVLGLDIGSSAVKMVQLRKDDAGYAVTGAGIVSIANGTESNENHKEINTARAISQCLQSTGIRTRWAVCSVCGQEAAVRYFKFPSLPPEEIQGAILLEAEQVCPFNINDSAVDYQLISDGDDSVRGVLVAATNKLIEGKSRLAKGASLNSVLMDVDGLALLNCFSKLPSRQSNHESRIANHEPRTTNHEDVGGPTAILNVGSSYTNLAIIGENSLPFVRDIAYAGNNIIAEIATENGVSTETVSRVLSGYEDSSKPQLELGYALQKACEKLIVDVTETLRYYAAQEKSALVEKIFVCGGFALVRGFVQLLDNQLPAAVVLWNPFEKIRCDAGQRCESARGHLTADILQENGPAMAVAAGLAMRSI